MLQAESLRSPMPGAMRLAPFVLLAVLLHLAALLALKPFGAPPIPATPPLQILLETSPPAADPPARHTIAPQIRAPAPSIGVAEIATPTPSGVPAPTTRQTPPTLDMANMLQQARTYASQSGRIASQPSSLEGDYYGSYDGFDTGAFSFHLDRNGYGNGSGLSSRFGVDFLISGKVGQDGVIRLSGSGVAGMASFSGTLDPRSGDFSGNWNLPGMGSGTFRGRREQPPESAIQPVPTTSGFLT